MAETRTLTPIPEGQTYQQWVAAQQPAAAAPAPTSSAALDTLRDLFSAWGLDSLADWLVQQEIAGQTPEQIVTDLRNRPEYKARFPAMDKLRADAAKNNMPAISEGDYLAMEAAYRRVLANSGLPTGMFDSADDFARLIENGVDPTEVAERVAAAKLAVDQTDPYVRSQLRDLYGITTTDLTAYALDPVRNSDYIRRVATTATLAGLSQRAGLVVEAGSWERYAQDMINQQMSEAEIVSSVSQAATLADTQIKLGQVEGEKVTGADMLDVVVNRDAKKTLKSQQRAARERARFAGTQGVGPSSLRGQGL